MDCRSKYFLYPFLTVALIVVLSGCISYRYDRYIYGVPIQDPGDQFPLIQTTIGDVLANLGAPDYIYSIDKKDMLVYRRSLLQENSLSLGIPLVEVTTGGSIDLSASGALTRSDVLTFFFNSDGLLIDMILEKGTDAPYLETLLP